MNDAIFGGRAALRAPRALVAIVALLALSAGCSRGNTPVGRLDVAPSRVTLAYPQPVSVRLTWTPKAPVESDTGTVVVFAHLLREPKQVVRTFDHPFPKAWMPGTPVSYDLDLPQSALVPPLAAGHYTLTVGLYDGVHERFALETAGKEVARREYAVAEVEVPAAQPPAPTFTFSPSWGAPEPSGDNQNPIRRWLDESGTIGVTGVPAAGVVRLRLRAPEVQAGSGERLLLDPGVARPTVAVVSTCDGTQTRVEGYGPHYVEIQVKAGQGCEIAVDPLFKVVRAANVTQRAPACIEELTWKPAAPAVPAVAP